MAKGNKMNNGDPMWNMSHKFVIKSWPKKDWTEEWIDFFKDQEFTRMLNEMTTDITVYRQEMMEKAVEDSKNTEAINMLNNIGIKC